MNTYNNILSSLNATPQKDGAANGNIYFIGIGGIGMSALARYFNSLGVFVSGYDKTATALSRQLETEGIAIHYEDNIALLDKQAQLVVYTPAVPKDHAELNYYQQQNYTVVKRSDVLGAVTNAAFNICVAGTHGKTTTSTMVAHLLRHSGFGCNAFLGGISGNYNSNFWSSDNDVCVVEADEYDRSFLKLSPDVAIISSMDADHLDIYGTAANMEEAFISFSTKIKTGGLLITKHGLKRTGELKATNYLTYDISNKAANVNATNIIMQDGSYRFDVLIETVNNKPWYLRDVVLNMGGMHNIENMLAAIAVAHHLTIDDKKIKAAVEAFKGVKRRFEYIIRTNQLVMIDDYAHHPEELRALITGTKELFSNKKCTVVFQPHLYSRTSDFANGFAEVLSLADEVILLPIYPARELPVEGVTSSLIAGKMKNKANCVLQKEALLPWLNEHRPELLITAGAGDIDTLVQPIKQLLEDSVDKINE